MGRTPKRPGDRRRKTRIVTRVSVPKSATGKPQRMIGGKGGRIPLYYRAKSGNEPAKITSNTRTGKPERRRGPVERRAGTDRRKEQIGKKIEPPNSRMGKIMGQFTVTEKEAAEMEKPPPRHSDEKLRDSEGNIRVTNVRFGDYNRRRKKRRSTDM